MQKSAAVALFLGSASSMNVNFATLNDDASFIQVTAQSAAKTESGVRARWTELPDCRHWCNFLSADKCKPDLDNPADGQPSGDYIPLRDDLANAIIATCKGPEPGCGPAVCVDPVAPVPGGWVANPATTIYDPVWKTSTVIPDTEHQVQGAGVHSYDSGADHQKTIINQTQQIVGPKGDFYTRFNWDFNSKGSNADSTQGAWDPAGGGGVDFAGDMTTETFHGWNPAASVPSTDGTTIAPWTDALVFLGEEHDKKWVELPDCSGGGDEIKLLADLTNATVATCKERPAA